VGTDSTAPTTSDTDLGTPIAINGGNTKSFVTGYPTLNETNLQATIRCYLDSTEANGNSLTEFGTFNNDGTKKMFSRSTFTSITKNTSTEISFVEKDKIN
ncbi:MAG: hypothetical protein ACOC5T_09785, partial [Elusimicrobiota bacterium]